MIHQSYQDKANLLTRSFEVNTPHMHEQMSSVITMVGVHGVVFKEGDA